MEFTMEFGAKRVALRCHASLRQQAEWLLELLQGIVSDKGGDILSDGYRFQVGWTIYTIAQQNHGCFALCEPDYSSDPFLKVHDDISCSLSVQAEQNDFQLTIGAAPLITSFQDKVLYSPAILVEKSIYLERKQPRPNDSGWYMGVNTNHADTDGLRACFAFELLRIRPEVMKVLQLPAGYLVVFDGNEVEAVLNAQDEIVFAR